VLKEPVTLTFIFQTISVVLVLSAIFIVMIKKSKNAKNKGK
jgi:hypothetical protein